VKPGLVVRANHGSVLVNRRPDGWRLKIQNTEHPRGLLCHALSKIEVHLPRPGKTFTSTVGVDANAGGGSVIFSVAVGGQQKFRSEVLRGGGPGVPISVDLAGATQFTIAVGDANDGNACDHADWADAKVVLTDGTPLWLSDLPVVVLEPHTRQGAIPPFSFVYGDKTSDELLGAWKLTETTRKLDSTRTERTQVYTDPQTGLVMRCVLVEYADYPTVEWTLHFKNTGTQATPIVSDILPLDTRLQCGAGSRFLLHHNVGSIYKPNDYQPLETVMGPGFHKRFAAFLGRPTHTELPYFNIECPATGAGDNSIPSRGVIAVIGWPGQWAADFVRDASNGLRLCGGQELTHFKLLPGEEVRTPLVVLQFWVGGDSIRAQNVWRRWMVAHNLPRPGGKLVPTHYGSCFGAAQPRADEEIAVINGFLREKIKLDYWFIDAGWYPDRGVWVNTGTWECDAKKFPRGLREVADHLHANGIKFVVWFEPERVTAGTWLTDNHPEWILGGKNGGLLNLGNPEAWKWVVEHFDRLITTQGVDVYRQDFNIEPLNSWRNNDAEDRQGITEIKHVTGYLAYWDELLRRHPDLLIDTCASGGRRNDLETLRRSVPLLRSDCYDTPLVQQVQTYGISSWIPYYGSGMTASDPYWLRSCIMPAPHIGWDTRRKDLDYPLLHRMMAEFRRVEPYLLGDHYPLTPYSLKEDAWMAWQFDRPEMGEGMVQAFRRPESTSESLQVRLRGLEADAVYTLTNFDVVGTTEANGRRLMEQGIAIVLKQRPEAAIIIYKKKQS
jgi:alpha-galactosidase